MPAVVKDNPLDKTKTDSAHYEQVNVISKERVDNYRPVTPEKNDSNNKKRVPIVLDKNKTFNPDDYLEKWTYSVVQKSTKWKYTVITIDPNNAGWKIDNTENWATCNELWLSNCVNFILKDWKPIFTNLWYKGSFKDWNQLSEDLWGTYKVTDKWVIFFNSGWDASSDEGIMYSWMSYTFTYINFESQKRLYETYSENSQCKLDTSKKACIKWTEKNSTEKKFYNEDFSFNDSPENQKSKELNLKAKNLEDAYFEYYKNWKTSNQTSSIFKKNADMHLKNKLSVSFDWKSIKKMFIQSYNINNFEKDITFFHAEWEAFENSIQAYSKEKWFNKNDFIKLFNDLKSWNYDSVKSAFESNTNLVPFHPTCCAFLVYHNFEKYKNWIIGILDGWNERSDYSLFYITFDWDTIYLLDWKTWFVNYQPLSSGKAKLEFNWIDTWLNTCTDVYCKTWKHTLVDFMENPWKNKDFDKILSNFKSEIEDFYK